MPKRGEYQGVKERLSKDFCFADVVRTGESIISREVIPTPDNYLGGEPHYTHIITAMAAMTRAKLEIKIYSGEGKIHSYPCQSIRLYTSAEQRDGDVTLVDPDTFILGVAVNSGVHYDVPDVPYKPAVVVPFTSAQRVRSPTASFRVTLSG